MRVTSGSDLARLQLMQQQARATRDRLDVAGEEMATNLRSDRFAATGGNLTRLFALERSLDRNAVFTETLSLTGLRLEVMQQGLTRIQAPAAELALDLSEAVGTGNLQAAKLHAASARADFAATVAVLNGQAAGQSLFSGTATDSAAVAPADAILADLDALTAAAPDAAATIAAIDAYFAKTPPGAFVTTRYLGSGTDLTPVDIGEGERLDYGMRADDDRIVAMLHAQALAAVTAGSYAGGRDDRMAMLAAAADRLAEASEGLLAASAEVGSLQETVERARASRIAERETLELARTGIVATDPLEAASAYQTLELQLEAIYTITSRLANLRFVNYMR